MGEPTSGTWPDRVLMRGASWYLDNRLFPHGWSHDHADTASTDAYGIGDDADYLAVSARGGDRVTYSIHATGDLTVEGRLLYQSVSPRWVAEIAAFDTEAIKRFLGMYEAADRTPVVLASASSH